MKRRPEPRFDWFIPIDGDGEHIGTWRAERPPTFDYLRRVVETAELLTSHPRLATDQLEDNGQARFKARAERWVEVRVEEAYIHCAKHIPRMLKVPREIAWGTDDVRRKGGDFFAASCESRPWADEPTATAPISS